MRQDKISDSLFKTGSGAIEGLLVGRKQPIFPGMKLQDIEQEALSLSECERAKLVLSLMNTLAAPASEVPDAEVLLRDEELENGRVEPMLHDEFVRRRGFRVDA